MSEFLSEFLNVLLIEDSEDDALLVLRELRRNGFELFSERVETADALQAALTNHSWDLLISDNQLPGFDATTALAILKQSQLDIPFIVISGTIGETLAVGLMRAGAHDYLIKGHLARLAETVRRELREAQSRAERQKAIFELDQTKERLQLAIEGAGMGSWDWSVQTGAMTVNERWAGMLGYSPEELEPISIATWQQYVHPEDLRRATVALEHHFRNETPAYECELRMRHKSGNWIWLLNKGKVVEWDAAGKPLRMAGTQLDIHDRKQAELRLELQNLVLEQIARAESLPKILDTVVRATEAQLEGSLCSILLCDHEGKLHCGAAPHLPAAYNQAIEGASIGEGAGSCGTAAFRRQRVIVSDIATDPLWQNYKELALAHELRACWSMPVIASDGPVLATFAVYHREIHSPDDRELEVITLVANITKIAIEREQATQALEQLNQELETRVVLRTAALQRSEARLREAQQVARLGHWELDMRTGGVTWSAEFLKILGLDLDEADLSYEQFLQNHFLRHERERFTQLIDRAIQSGEPQDTDLQIIRADGSSGYIFAKAELSQHAEGPANRLFGIVMDITDRKTIQAALQLSEERARATLLALPDVVFRVNRAGRYMDFLVSPPGKNLIDPNQVVGKYLHEVLPPEIAEAHAATQYMALQEALATQTVQIYEQQVWINGQLCYEEVRVAPCGTDEVVFFVRDISDRKQAEAKLTETNHQLAISNQELARATRLKDEFLANMSHELRTPLNAILGMTDGLQEEVFGPINERQLKALKTVERSGSHLLELINDILDVAKIEAGQIELDYSSTSIAELCQSSLAFVKQQALQKRIQLQIKLASQLPDLLVDERRIRQVLINLLNNAVKFTPEGGEITLEVSRTTAPPTTHNPEADDCSPQAFLRIAVIDTGIGISAENIAKLFQPFVQIDSALNRKYQGTGLGLALVKRITELHGGRVELTSELGLGSCFAIELPYSLDSLCSPDPSSLGARDRCTVSDGESSSKSDSEFNSESGSESGATGSASLILLVEDNEANISTVSNYLAAKGYQILLANHGQAAIELAKTHQPDLILMDIQMPEMDGLEATHQIRLDPDLADIPIIALTALAMAGDREKCLAAGANEYMTKPVKLKQLTTIIQNLLDKSNHYK